MYYDNLFAYSHRYNLSAIFIWASIPPLPARPPWFTLIHCIWWLLCSSKLIFWLGCPVNNCFASPLHRKRLHYSFHQPRVPSKSSYQLTSAPWLSPHSTGDFGSLHLLQFLVTTDHVVAGWSAQSDSALERKLGLTFSPKGTSWSSLLLFIVLPLYSDNVSACRTLCTIS